MRAAKRIPLILNDTQMSTSVTTHCNAKCVFGVQRYRGTTLTGAFIHKCPWYSLHREACYQDFTGAHARSHTATGTTDLDDSSMVSPHCATRRWTMHENQCSTGQGRVHSADGKQRSSSYSVFRPPVRDTILEIVSVPQPSKRHSVPSSTFGHQHRPSCERKVL